MRRRPLDVAKDPFQQGVVVVRRCMHVQTDLLHGVSDVRTREGQVLQRASHASVPGGLLWSQWCPVADGWFGFGIGWCIVAMCKGRLA
jgi:hypothetical protein